MIFVDHQFPYDFPYEYQRVEQIWWVLKKKEKCMHGKCVHLEKLRLSVVLKRASFLIIFFMNLIKYSDFERFLEKMGKLKFEKPRVQSFRWKSLLLGRGGQYFSGRKLRTRHSARWDFCRAQVSLWFSLRIYRRVRQF